MIFALRRMMARSQLTNGEAMKIAASYPERSEGSPSFRSACETGTRGRRAPVRLSLILSLALLFGCTSVEVAHDVDQRQANRIVSVLNQNGISAFAQKESGGRGKYTVLVKQNFYSQAATIIDSGALLKEEGPSFNELIAQHGLIPSSREIEALRVDRALAAELEEVLRSHPAVISARVIVRFNFSRSDLGQQSEVAPAEPSVSVILQLREGQELKNEEVVEIVKRALPGIKTEGVSVESQAIVVDNSPYTMAGAYLDGSRVIRVPLVPFLYFWRVPDEDHNTLAFCLIGFLALIGLAAWYVGYWLGLYGKKKPVTTNLPEVVSKANRVVKTD